VRIGIVAPPWVSVPPVAYGGTEAVLDTLARGLQSAGHDVLLCATGDSTCSVPRSSVIDHAIGIGVGGAATELRHVAHAYAQVADCDVVHDHTLVGPFYAQRFPGLAVVTTNHGPFDSELGDVYRALGSAADVVAISDHQASLARGVDVAAVIHHGIDPSDFPVGSGGGYAVFLGRMSATKGVETAARVARAAGIPLLIAAKLNEPAEYEYFDNHVRPLLGAGVEYVGEVGPAEKKTLLGGARCLLNPIAWSEPFGMVMIEALACGTPVVATPFGAVPEIVRDGVTGIIAIGDLDLAAAVDQVGSLDRDDCRRAVEGHFSARRMVDDHVSLYEQLAAGEHPILLGAYTEMLATPSVLVA
jgi:glycosyltransferase involved in cell wall biosynthesis